MRKVIGLIVLAILAGVVPAAALPDYAMHVTYYDEDGNVVGYWDAICHSGYYSSGTATGISTVEIWEPCYDLAPLACQDFGMSELSTCSGIGWCVSDGYAMSYYNDLVPNCAGKCAWGENSPCWGLGPCDINFWPYCHAKQTLGRRTARKPPVMMWRTRSNITRPAGGSFLTSEPVFNFQSWHSYLKDLRD